MKRIEAIIKPRELEKVKVALGNIGIDSLTITEVRGHGRQKGHVENYRGVEYQVNWLARIKLEVVVSNADADEAIRTLAAAARTGQIGDGKIFVSDVAEAVRIRTGERGEVVL